MEIATTDFGRRALLEDERWRATMQDEAQLWQLLELAAKHGVWLHVCKQCGQTVSGRLAQFEKTTTAELEFVACPTCTVNANKPYHGKDYIRIEYHGPECSDV